MQQNQLRGRVGQNKKNFKLPCTLWHFWVLVVLFGLISETGME